jgi:hypothetical protein
MQTVGLKRWRILALTGATVMATSAILGFAAMNPADSAHADGIGSVFSHGSGGSTALGVYGTGLRVDSVRVSHGDGGGIYNMCGFQSKAWGTIAYGSTAWTSTFGYTSGCTPFPFYNNKTVGATFAPSSTIKGQSYHDGAWAPGIPQVKITY